ncbi:hypothetical protein [uncultured Fusobacterium sp.]|uniref:hypothetical protein n=1 Tax=uncultured Fusobacterium sp. TaxID=159267 RepID=UPI0025EDBDCD|nr:hypothetical protein [uncultured Fusobacterium sp.]
MKSNYFISYFYERNNGIVGQGNVEITLENKIINKFSIIKEIESILRINNDFKNVCVMNFIKLS